MTLPIKKIFKYPFQINDSVCIRMPKGAHILTVQTQGGQSCLWALANPDAELKDHNFRIFGTGHPISGEEMQSMGYVGTFLMPSGLVWHMFCCYSTDKEKS